MEKGAPIEAGASGAGGPTPSPLLFPDSVIVRLSSLGSVLLYCCPPFSSQVLLSACSVRPSSYHICFSFESCRFSLCLPLSLSFARKISISALSLFSFGKLSFACFSSSPPPAKVDVAAAKDAAVRAEGKERNPRPPPCPSASPSPLGAAFSRSARVSPCICASAAQCRCCHGELQADGCRGLRSEQRGAGVFRF